jgi:hypothetical protein
MVLEKHSQSLADVWLRIIDTYTADFGKFIRPTETKILFLYTIFMMIRNSIYPQELQDFWNGKEGSSGAPIFNFTRFCIVVKSLESTISFKETSTIRKAVFDTFRFVNRAVVFGIIFNKEGLNVLKVNDFAFTK